MAYEKQTWKTGEVITAEKLNHIEDGIDGIGFYSIKEDREIGDTGIAASFNELVDLSENGIVAINAIDGQRRKIWWLSSLGHDGLYQAIFIGYNVGLDHSVTQSEITFTSNDPDAHMTWLS